MTYLKDILPNRGELISMLEQGYVRKQVHPTEPLMIFNYTEKAMFDRVWNLTTRTCRGLIVNMDTYEIVARPFAKFFNYGEGSADKIDLTDYVTVTDKLDGSLGILYRQPRAKQWAIATRGSFTSEQAAWATDWFQKYSSDWFDQFTDRTFLFEILVSWNRIVLNYDWEGLVLLGAVDMKSGACVDIPNDPRILQAGTSRDDRGKY